MARLSLMGAALFVFVLFVTSSLGGYSDCGSGSPRLVEFLSFSAYPDSPSPGQYLHFAATYKINQDISSGNVAWTVSYQNSTLLSVTNIQLCNFTSSVNCDQLAVSNSSIPITFDWLVPDIPYGDYVVTYEISLPGNAILPGCITFDVNIGQSTANQADNFVSYYEAFLIGSANYSVQDNNYIVQVGPVGVMYFAQNLPWGIFSSVSGSGDIITPSFDPTYYIWGLTGNRTSNETDELTGKITEVYAGRFYVGYRGPYGAWDSNGNFLTEGLFVFYRYTSLDGTITINGNIQFYPADGVFPAGWYNPINLARLGTANLTTNEHGQLMVGTNASRCLTNPSGICAPAALIAPGSSRRVSNRELGYILGFILGGIALIALIAVLAFLVHRRRMRRAEEDRVYRSKPNEYGDALVVDDIIQKSRAHRGAALPMLNPRNNNGDLPPAYFEQYPLPGRRSSRVPRPIGREPSLRASMSSRSRAPYSDDDSSEPTRDNSRSRSRSRSPRRRSTRAESRRSLSSRSSSPDSRRYSDSASGSSRSRSRSRSRSASPNSRSSYENAGPRR